MIKPFVINLQLLFHTLTNITNTYKGVFLQTRNCLSLCPQFCKKMQQYKKVAFYTLGCKLNFSETSTISRLFENAGFAKVDFEETPDILVINTCSVTENADKKCKQLVRRAKKINPEVYIAIIGCYAQLKPTEIAQIPGVSLVL